MAESSPHPQSPPGLPLLAFPKELNQLQCVPQQAHGVHAFPCARVGTAQQRGKGDTWQPQWDTQLCPVRASVPWGRVALSCHIPLLGTVAHQLCHCEPHRSCRAGGQVGLAVCHRKLCSHRVWVCNNIPPKSLLPQVRSAVPSWQQTPHEVLRPAAGQARSRSTSAMSHHSPRSQVTLESGQQQRAEPWLHVQGEHRVLTVLTNDGQSDG